MNVMSIGGTYWLQIIFKKDQAVERSAVHAHFINEVVFPSYKSCTNNSTLHPTFLLCNDKLYIESSSSKEFFSQLIVNLERYLGAYLYIC